MSNEWYMVHICLCYLLLMLSVIGNDSFKGRRGRPCLTLLDTIRSDLVRKVPEHQMCVKFHSTRCA